MRQVARFIALLLALFTSVSATPELASASVSADLHTREAARSFSYDAQSATTTSPADVRISAQRPERTATGDPWSSTSAIPLGRAAKGRTASAGRTAARSCSFGGATTVLMADGSRKPIEDVAVGDKVIATDPETGEQAPKRVEHVWIHDDTVVDLAVDGEVITTTEDHPFWSVTDQQFERADQLAEGELLRSAGRPVRVAGLRLATARTSLAYNLSVKGIHTYHVGDGAVLVHNSCYSSLDALNDPKAVEGLTPSQIDDLARNAGFEVLPGKASAVTLLPATTFRAPIARWGSGSSPAASRVSRASRVARISGTSVGRSPDSEFR